MIHIHAIDHIVLRSETPETLIRFYVDILNCSIVRRTEADIGLTQLRAGSALIDIVDTAASLGKLGGAAPSGEGNNLDHFCLQIAPIGEQELIHYLQQHQIECGEFAERFGAQGWGRSLYIQDPDGNTVELRCHKGES